MSTNLHVALRAHSRQAHEDIALALLENARLSVGFHKHVLRELEAVRPDIARIGKTAGGQSAVTNGKAPATGGLQGSAYQSAPLSEPPYNSGSSFGRLATSQPPTHQPSMVSSRPYNSPPLQSAVPGQRPNNVSQSMFLPPPSQAGQSHRASGFGPLGQSGAHQATDSAPPHGRAGVDPLGGQMAQSMYVPGPAAGGTQNAQRQQAAGRPVRRLDERQAAKMLAGGF